MIYLTYRIMKATELTFKVGFGIYKNMFLLPIKLGDKLIKF